MTESVLESNNQERRKKSKDILRETEDAPLSPAAGSHLAVVERAHPGGDLAQEVGEDEAEHQHLHLVEHHPLHLVPPRHRPA